MKDVSIFEKEEEALFKDFRETIDEILKEEPNKYGEGVKDGIEYSAKKIHYLLNGLKVYFDDDEESSKCE